MVLDGSLTIMVGDPARREVLPTGTVAAVRAGIAIHVRNESDRDVTFLAYGAPPVKDAADELPEPAEA